MSPTPPVDPWADERAYLGALLTGALRLDDLATLILPDGSTPLLCAHLHHRRIEAVLWRMLSAGATRRGGGLDLRRVEWECRKAMAMIVIVGPHSFLRLHDLARSAPRRVVGRGRRGALDVLDDLQRAAFDRFMEPGRIADEQREIRNALVDFGGAMLEHAERVAIAMGIPAGHAAEWLPLAIAEAAKESDARKTRRASIDYDPAGPFNDMDPERFVREGGAAAVRAIRAIGSEAWSDDERDAEAEGAVLAEADAV